MEYCIGNLAIGIGRDTVCFGGKGAKMDVW